MGGFEGRENVRSTLGFLESMRALGATVKKEARKTDSFPFKSSLSFPA